MSLKKSKLDKEREFRSSQYDFRITGRKAMFTDPMTKTGGEKCSYLAPTFEALKGIAKNVYWKPTFILYIDALRIMNPFRTESMGVTMADWTNLDSAKQFFTYCYLTDVEYQVRVHFEWNMEQKFLEEDRIPKKHEEMFLRSVKRGGRFSPFLGTSECPSDITPCTFGEGEGYFDNVPSFSLGLMFHSFMWPGEFGGTALRRNLWRPEMKNGVITFPRPEDCALQEVVKELPPEDRIIFGSEKLKTA